MSAIVILVASLIVGSKILDCWSTWIRIKGIENEQNPFVRALMARIGIGPAIWSVLIIETVIVLFSTWALLEYFDYFIWKLLFVFVGGVVVIVQLAVAHSNYYGRQNHLTMVAAKFLRGVCR